VLTAREDRRAADNAAVLAAEGLSVEGRGLDVSSDAGAAAFAAGLERDFGRLDVLVNNAAGVFDAKAPTVTAEFASVQAALDVNLFGPWRMVRALEPLLRRGRHPRIVNISSEAASFGAPRGMATRGGGLGAYTVSKAAQNALTVKLAAAFKDTPILVNAVCPGWIATYPGTAEMGARPVADGARGVVFAAMLQDGGPSGRFFRDGREMAW
jgi:NAD(P)-dependent dehydrogenase (short-subunit alcohol dehydrogenase family)